MLSKDEIQKNIDATCPKYNVKKATLFGSYAHGTATEDSDVDVLIEFFSKQTSFDNQFGFQSELKEKLGVEVDVIVGPLSEKSVFVLDENGVPKFVTSEERDRRLIPAIMHDIRRISEVVQDKCLCDFLDNEDMQDIVSMRIVKLAEKTKVFSKGYFERNPFFPREDIISNRNILSHCYGLDEDGTEFEVNYEKVWRFVQDKILPLEQQLK